MQDSKLTFKEFQSACERRTGVAAKVSSDGREFRIPCPVCGSDSREPLVVTARDDGKILTYCHAHGCSFDAIRDSLPVTRYPRGHEGKQRTRRRLNIGTPPDNPTGTGKGKRVTLIPPWHRTQTRFQYFTVAGESVYAVRSDPENRDQYDKEVWREPAGVKGPYLPYQLEKWQTYRKPRPVLIVEGEATAHAAESIFSGYVVLTSIGGSGSAAHTDWSYLRHKNVTIWPDSCDSGWKYAIEVTKLAHRKGARSVSVVDVPESFPDDWDLANEPPEGADLCAMLESAGTIPRDDGFIAWGDLMNEPDESIPWIVESLLPSAGLSVVVGDPKVGKSTAVRSLCAAMVTGDSWLGRKCERGSVLYLGMEGKRQQIKAHFAKLGIPATAELTVFIGSRVDDSDPVQWLTDYVEIYKPALTIVDTMARIVHVKDGNSYHEVTAKVEPFEKLARESGTHLCFVHHARKSSGKHGQEILGSQAWGAAVDTIISLKRDEDDGARWVESTSRGDAVDLPASVIEEDKQTGIVTITGTLERRAELAIQDSILAFVEDEAANSPGGQVLHSSVLRGVRGKTKTKIAALNSLVESGRLIRNGTGGKGSRYSYGIPAGVLAVVARGPLPVTGQGKGAGEGVDLGCNGD